MSKKVDNEISRVSNFVSKMAAYEDLFERTIDSVLLLDVSNFSILDANGSAVRILADAKENILGRNFLDWISADKRQDFSDFLNECKKAYYAKTLVLSWLQKNGRTLTLDLTVCSLKLSSGAQVLQIIARDISHELELQRRTENYLKELQAANLKLASLSQTDELTGLSNFRHFHQLLKAEHERASEEGHTYSVLFFDLDNFKLYNDRHGHVAGDNLLRELGKILKANCRKGDLPARYGGEEFAVLCIGTPADTALKIAKRIQTAVATHPFPHRELQPLGCVSVSIGVASYPKDGADASHVVNAADDAAYRSKRNGRNQVSVATKLAA